MAPSSSQSLLQDDAQGSANSSSFPLGNIFGIPVRMHVMFPAILVLSVIYAGGWRDWATVLFYFVLLGPVLLATVLLHELGHCAATWRLAGGHVDHILLWPLGGLAYVGHGSGPREDLQVALAGPATHVPQALLWLLALVCVRPHYVSLGVYAPMESHFAGNLAAAGVWVNISLFCFNLLLPAYPLDGGRILANVLLLAGLGAQRAAVVTLCVSTPIAALIVLYGFVASTPVTAMVGLWVLFQNAQLFTLVRDGHPEYHPLFSAKAGETPVPLQQF